MFPVGGVRPRLLADQRQGQARLRAKNLAGGIVQLVKPQRLFHPQAGHEVLPVVGHLVDESRIIQQVGGGVGVIGQPNHRTRRVVGGGGATLPQRAGHDVCPGAIPMFICWVLPSIRAWITMLAVPGPACGNASIMAWQAASWSFRPFMQAASISTHVSDDT